VSWAKPAKSYAGMLDEARTIARRTLRGARPNMDTWIDAS
jgi:hypothetical protein